MSEEVKTEEPKKKGIFGKLKEASEDKEEQLAILSTFVRLGILVWSGGILTLAYVDLPKALQFPEQDLDPTFIASVFTGVLATFGVQTAKKSGDGTMKMNGANAAAAAGGITKADLEKLIEAAKSTGPVQTIKVEQAPLKITTDDTYKM
mgnify:CR=1 FL=1